MPLVHLIRHARPAAAWGVDPDPGLDAVGLEQAEATAHAMALASSPLPLYTSPLRRCRETAGPLERTWNCIATVVPACAEIPAPPLDQGERRAWLDRVLAGTWTDLEVRAEAGWPDYAVWRATLLRSLESLAGESIVFTHFIAINAVVAAALGRNEVVCFQPDHASITTVDISPGGIRIVSRGDHGDTAVLT